jgi:hypothetical protein
MSTSNGGPAFPVPGLQQDEDFNGMTLRDYFAAQALTTVAAYDSHDVDTWTPRDFAHHAYALADAMLAERAK